LGGGKAIQPVKVPVIPGCCLLELEQEEEETGKLDNPVYRDNPVHLETCC